MGDIPVVTQKAQKNAEIAAKLVQASVGSQHTDMNIVLDYFDRAYAHVTRKINHEATK